MQASTEHDLRRAARAALVPLLLFLGACEEAAPPAAGGEAARERANEEPGAGPPRPGSPAVESRDGRSRDGGGADIEGPDAGSGDRDDVSPAGPAAGAIEGRVVYRGRLPETTTMYVPEAGEIEAHTVIVDPATRGLKDVAVWVEVSRRRPASPRSEPAVMDQRDWVFAPHVLTVRAGESVRFLNSDVANHNVHSWTSGHEFNLGTPAGEGTIHRFLRPTGSDPVRLGCDIHDWMRAWIYVFPHDLHAVTGKEGEFRIEGVPPGTWTLRAHHADGALETSLEVRVEAGRGSEVEVELEE